MSTLWREKKLSRRNWKWIRILCMNNSEWRRKLRIENRYPHKRPIMTCQNRLTENKFRARNYTRPAIGRIYYGAAVQNFPEFRHWLLAKWIDLIWFLAHGSIHDELWLTQLVNTMNSTRSCTSPMMNQVNKNKHLSLTINLYLAPFSPFIKQLIVNSVLRGNIIYAVLT